MIGVQVRLHDPSPCRVISGLSSGASAMSASGPTAAIAASMSVSAGGTICAPSLR